MPKTHKLVLDKSALIDVLDAPAIKLATLISDDFESNLKNNNFKLMTAIEPKADII